MNFKGILAACVLSLSGTTGLSATYTDMFSSFFVFGDSLAENGKFGQQFPPSFGGRFTNGLTYAERIAGDFQAEGKATFNFALGGATAGPVNTSAYPDPVAVAPFATFGAQIATFAAAFDAPAGTGGNPLFSVLFGGNDILQNLGVNPLIGLQAANSVKAGIEAISALNPLYDSFVVANLPDLARTPRFAGTPLEGLVQLQSDSFNDQLGTNLAMLRDSGLEIIEFDIAGLLADIIDDPAAYGILDVTTPCTDSLQSFNPFDNCAFSLLGGLDLSDADDFLFVDPIHPNRVAHAAAADRFRAAVTVATTPVPLPAGLPLLLVGICAFGWMRLRREA